jgi:dienelactone hydrolase
MQTIKLNILTIFVALLLSGSFTVPASAQTSPLPEEVLMIKKPGIFSLELETTFFKPEGNGPFPLVVINHGKAFGDPKFQGRSSYPRAARFFLSRGYAVALPMRQGFSKSTGSYIGGGCNVGSNGAVQADDVKATLDYFVAQPFIDKTKILVAGQSHGGLTTMAFGTFNYPGVKGLINFAGGLKQETCAAWESVLARAFGSYAKDTQVPSIWFYGDNDSYWPKEVWQSMYGKYVENLPTTTGAKAQMIAFGTFVTDAHNMFGHNDGQKIWQPEVDKFLAQLGLPNAIIFSQYATPVQMAVPARTNFAEINSIDALPHLRETGKKGYERFLTLAYPRAFAIAPSGAWGSSVGQEDDLANAINNCNKNAPQKNCKLYAVNDDVVWVPQ